jgi:hypothetical protein
MRRSQLQIIIYRWLFRTFERRENLRNGRPKIERVSKLLYMLLMDTSEIQLILSKECPFCHRKFSRKLALRNHLEHYGNILGGLTTCKLHFAQLLNNIVDTYCKMRYLITYSNNKYYVKGCVGYFRTLEEAYKKAKEILNNGGYNDRLIKS